MRQITRFLLLCIYGRNGYSTGRNGYSTGRNGYSAGRNGYSVAETAIVLAETVTILKNWAEMVGRIGLAEMTCILWEVKYFLTNKYMRQTAAIG